MACPSFRKRLRRIRAEKENPPSLAAIRFAVRRKGACGRKKKILRSRPTVPRVLMQTPTDIRSACPRLHTNIIRAHSQKFPPMSSGLSITVSGKCERKRPCTGQGSTGIRLKKAFNNWHLTTATCCSILPPENRYGIGLRNVTRNRLSDSWNHFGRRRGNH